MMAVCSWDCLAGFKAFYQSCSIGIYIIDNKVEVSNLIHVQLGPFKKLQSVGVNMVTGGLFQTSSGGKVGWFYVLATVKVISEWVPTCDYAHLRRLYSATSLGDQAVSTMS